MRGVKNPLNTDLARALGFEVGGGEDECRRILHSNDEQIAGHRQRFLLQNIFISAFDFDLITLITKRVMQYDTSVTLEMLQGADW
eukprot:3558142-Karenia_brevis.AAC.1